MIYSNLENKIVYDEIDILKENEKKYSFNLRGWKSKIEAIEAIEEINRTPEQTTELYNSNLLKDLVNIELTEITRRLLIIESELFFKYKLIANEINIQNLKEHSVGNPSYRVLEIQKVIDPAINNNTKRYNEIFKQWGTDLESIRNSSTSVLDFVLYNKYYRVIDTNINTSISVQNEISTILGAEIQINTLTTLETVEKLNNAAIYNEFKINEILENVKTLTLTLNDWAPQLASLWSEAKTLGILTNVIANHDSRWEIQIGEYLVQVLGDTLENATKDAPDLLETVSNIEERQEFTKSFNVMNLQKLKSNFKVGEAPKIESIVDDDGLVKSSDFSESKFNMIFPQKSTDSFFLKPIYPTKTTILQEEGMSKLITECLEDSPIVIDLI